MPNTEGGLDLGVEGLDRVLGRVVPPYVMVIAGHPGSGKTSLASTVCYKATLAGRKCLYVTFQEDRERFLKFTSSIGLKLADAEAANLFRFIRLPIALSVEEAIDVVSRELTRDGYSVVVVDSVNALLEAVGADSSRRAWLVNFFYNVTQATGSLCILIAELPFGSERIELGSIEFVADAVILLKHRVEGGFLVRIAEVRKVRGAPIYLAEVPFTISSSGVVFWSPPILEGVPSEGPQLELPCTLLRGVLNHLHRGMVINLLHPPEGDTANLYGVLLGTLLANNLRVHFISYKYPPELLREFITYWLTTLGLSLEEAEHLLGRYVKVSSINPFSLSPSELVARELSLLKSGNCDAVVFHGVELGEAFASSSGQLGDFLRGLFNELLYLKHGGYLVVRMGKYLSEEVYSATCSVADVVIKPTYVVKDVGDVEVRTFISRRNRVPYVASQEELLECVRETGESLRTLLRRYDSEGKRT